MQLTTKTFQEGVHATEFLLSYEDEYSLDQGVVPANSPEMVPGTILGKQLVGNLSAAAAPGNTGNGVMSAPVALPGVDPGVYNLVFVSPTKYEAFDQTGSLIGEGVVGALFNVADIQFTISAGATAFVAGDAFAITATAGAGKFVPYSATATDGSATVVGILYGAAHASAYDQNVTLVTRQAEVAAYALTGLDLNAQAQLAAKGIIVRS